MFENLLSSSYFQEEQDDHDFPFPAGTPFKGVVRSKDFINGPALAQAIGLTAGFSSNPNSGWLHFIEDNGYEIYIAKKTLRYKVTWQECNAAQSGKTLTIGGRDFVVEFMTGAKTDPSTVDNTQAGGQWNRYMYNIFGGSRASELNRQVWGNYTNAMLNIQEEGDSASQGIGTGSWTKEAANGTSDGYISRGRYPSNGVPVIASFWYGRPQDVAANVGTVYGWRPMLVLKGTTPPVPVTPFKGEVAQADFITAADLATAVGLTSGTVTNAGTPWLKIEEDGKTYYLAKTSLRHTVTKEQLEARGIVTGSTTVVIAGKTYKVRCMTGRATNPSNTVAGEWLRWYTALTDGTWASYTTAQLITGTGLANNGQLVIVQEDDTRGRGTNGYPGLMGPWYHNANVTNAGYGWRPVLELVP
ncbi:virion structural protein [Pseudomonas phage D6]|nr:virion structural protein [Pseudomonas phage D6]